MQRYSGLWFGLASVLLGLIVMGLGVMTARDNAFYVGMLVLSVGILLFAAYA